MERWGRLAWRLGVSVWLGTIFFLFVGIGPHVFTVLPASEAGHLVDAIFPVYDAEGLVFGALMILGALLLLGSRRDERRWVLVGVAIVNWLLAWASEATLRAMQHLEAGAPRFHQLHAESVIFSVAMFLLVLFGLIWDVLSL
ncbi:DUF4149 domain-containing protein [Sulfobacillus harzensis]|uniref:DUF4149 domain-containing protein n=1 Tax=Sulfobacillus harzensis TaxID=2729629 RepID=A0A7Y0Q3Q4_9FIRM|nr:DUF4149 domain-containing protein [Sulfobacillus harzensis]